MRQRLFITLGMASLAMATFGMKKPKAAIKPLNAATVQQPSYTEWHDLQVNAINRFPLHTNFFTYSPEDMVYEEGGKLVSRDLAQVNKTMSKNYLSLEGTWKFNWVENADQRPTDFYKVDLDDSNWKPIIVPGNWEMYGYGVPEYVNVGFGWRGHFDEQPPAVPTKDNHVGSYRRIINIPENWVPAIQLVSFDEADHALGFLNLRLRLNDYLLEKGGHIGYSIRPSERGKGYAKESLRQGLQVAKDKNIHRALVTCSIKNPASRAVILANGGQLEDIRHETERYWIDLE